MLKDLFAGLIASTLFVGTVQASDLGTLGSGFEPGYASVLMGLGTQDSVDDAGSNTDESESSDFYLRLGVGVNIMPYTDVEGAGAVSGDSITWLPGVDLNLALGYSATENIAFELEVGVQNNYVDYTSYVFVNGSAYLTQVPVMAKIRYDFNVTEIFTIGIYGGVGFQYSSFQLNGLSDSSTSFRFQLGWDMAWNVSNDTSIGFYSRYGASSSNEFEDLSTESFQNFSFGAMFKFVF